MHAIATYATMQRLGDEPIRMQPRPNASCTSNQARDQDNGCRLQPAEAAAGNCRELMRSVSRSRGLLAGCGTYLFFHPHPPGALWSCCGPDAASVRP